MIKKPICAICRAEFKRNYATEKTCAAVHCKVQNGIRQDRKRVERESANARLRRAKIKESKE